jgi:hypothetical protein
VKPNTVTTNIVKPNNTVTTNIVKPNNTVTTNIVKQNNTVKPNNTVKSNLSKKFKSVRKQGLLTLHPNKGGNNVLFRKFKEVYENTSKSKDIQIQNMEKIIKEFEKSRSGVPNKQNVLKLPNKPNVLKLPNKPNVPMNKINVNPNEENKAVGKISTLESLKKVGANIRRINNAKKKLTGNTRPRSERRVDNKERLKELKKVVKKKDPRLSPSKINMEARKMLKKEKGT